MEQLYIEALLIHWRTRLKFSSENRNPQIPEIGRKNWPIHPYDLGRLNMAEYGNMDFIFRVTVRYNARQSYLGHRHLNITGQTIGPKL